MAEMQDRVALLDNHLCHAVEHYKQALRHLPLMRGAVLKDVSRGIVVQAIGLSVMVAALQRTHFPLPLTYLAIEEFDGLIDAATERKENNATDETAK
jgi:hypothetical protein